MAFKGVKNITDFHYFRYKESLNLSQLINLVLANKLDQLPLDRADQIKTSAKYDPDVLNDRTSKVLNNLKAKKVITISHATWLSNYAFFGNHGSYRVPIQHWTHETSKKIIRIRKGAC
jgi:hypothetical protein